MVTRSAIEPHGTAKFGFVRWLAQATAAHAENQMLFALGMPMFYFTAIFSRPWKKLQFAHSRARLTPQFFPASRGFVRHFVDRCSCSTQSRWPSLSRVKPSALVALAVAIGVPTLWGAKLNRFSAMIIALVIFYSLLTDWGLSGG